MTAPGWERSPDGGYRSVEQGHAFRALLEQYAKTYLWACWLYYHGPANVESPLTDHEFDRMQQTLVAYWQEAPDWFKARCPKPAAMKSDAHHIALSPEEQQQALAWAGSDGR